MKAIATGSSVLRPSALVAVSAAVAVVSTLLVFRMPLGDVDVALQVNGARMLLGLAAGLSLGAAGMLLGGGAAVAVRAPLIFAASSGAAGGVALGTLSSTGIGGTTTSGLALCAVFVAVVFWLGRAGRGGNIALAALLPLMFVTAVLSAGVGSAARAELGGTTAWLLGDLSRARAGAGSIHLVLVVVFLGVLLWRAREATLDDPRALPAASGLPYLAPLLLGLGVGAAGPVAFVGWAAGVAGDRLLGAGATAAARVGVAAALGAAFLMAADGLTRLAVGGYAMPLNVSIGAVAIPVFLWWNRSRLKAEDERPRGRLFAAAEVLLPALASLFLLGFALAYVDLIRSHT